MERKPPKEPPSLAEINVQREQILSWLTEGCHEAFPCPVCTVLIEHDKYEDFHAANEDAHNS